MHEAVRQPLARMDHNPDFGRSWRRHRSCDRRETGLKMLEAGCGTGLMTPAPARLNPP